VVAAPGPDRRFQVSQPIQYRVHVQIKHALRMTASGAWTTRTAYSPGAVPGLISSSISTSTEPPLSVEEALLPAFLPDSPDRPQFNIGALRCGPQDNRGGATAGRAGLSKFLP
jgi:hypothetical protein